MKFKKDSFEFNAIKASAFSILAKVVAALVFYTAAILLSKSSGIDLFFLQFNYISALAMFIANLSAITIVPRAIGFKSNSNLKQKHAIVNYFYIFLLTYLSPVILISFVNPEFLFLKITSLSKSEILQFHDQLLFFSPLLVIQLFICWLSDILLIENNFTSISLSLLVGGGLNLIFILVFNQSLAEMAWYYGWLIGSFISLLILFLFVFQLKWNFKLKRIPFNYHFIKDTHLTGLTNLFITFTISLLPIYVFSSTKGLVPSMNFASKITDLFNQLVVNFLINLSFLRIAEYYATNSQQKIADSFYKLILFITALAVPFSILLHFNHSIIIKILYQGKLTNITENYTNHILGYLSLFMVLQNAYILFSKLGYLYNLHKNINNIHRGLYLCLLIFIFLNLEAFSVDLLFIGFTLIYLTIIAFVIFKINKINTALKKPLKEMLHVLFIVCITIFSLHCINYQLQMPEEISLFINFTLFFVLYSLYSFILKVPNVYLLLYRNSKYIWR